MMYVCDDVCCAPSPLLDTHVNASDMTDFCHLFLLRYALMCKLKSKIFTFFVFRLNCCFMLKTFVYFEFDPWVVYIYVLF